MKSGNRLVLMAWLALAASAGLASPSSADEVPATSARIAELSRAGKYSEATVLAQRATSFRPADCAPQQRASPPSRRIVAPVPVMPAPEHAIEARQ
jgi:hypothetical protein